MQPAQGGRRRRRPATTAGAPAGASPAPVPRSAVKGVARREPCAPHGKGAARIAPRSRHRSRWAQQRWSRSLSFPCRGHQRASEGVERRRQSRRRPPEHARSRQRRRARRVLDVSRGVVRTAFLHGIEALPESCCAAVSCRPSGRGPRCGGAGSIHAMPRRTRRPRIDEARSHFTFDCRHGGRSGAAALVWVRS